MKCIWLGQAGLLFDFDGIRVMVDPYFSDSVAEHNPSFSPRRVAPDLKFCDIRPDILIWLPVPACLAIASYLIPKNL